MTQAVGSPARIAPLFDGPLDVVGDIHGEIDALHDLLGHLGYDAQGEHPAGRRLVFVGDLTDRGPDSPAVIDFVRPLLERQRAQCILGNHELNLLRHATKEGNGWFFDDNHDLREGKFRDSRPLAAAARPALLAMLAQLPLVLERPDLRLVHAAWHEQSIAAIRNSPLSTLELYRHYEHHTSEVARASGLANRAGAQKRAIGAMLKDRHSDPGLLADVAALDELYQLGNPVRVVTSGIERVAKEPYYVSGKWRMVNRVRWWEEYEDSTPVIIGHYWRWPSRFARDEYSRSEPNLFDGYRINQWLGARRNVFCVDYAVGARYKERAEPNGTGFDCRLGAVRWPERELVFDDGRRFRLE